MPDMVLVTWVDHSFHSGEWDGDEDDLKVMRFQTVAWAMEDRGDGQLRLAMSYDEDSEQFSDALVVDGRMVEKVEALRRVGSRKQGGQAEA